MEANLVYCDDGSGPTCAKWWVSCRGITTGDRPMGIVAKVSDEQAVSRNSRKVLEGLLKFMDERRQPGSGHEGGFEAFEREVRQRFSEAEREYIGEELERLDITVPVLVIGGVRHRRVTS